MPPEMNSTAGAAQWAALSDALLAGLVHMLNNRVTALSVCAELATMGDEQMLSSGVLTTEMRRMQAATALIGLLPSRPQPPEALELRPVLESALEMYAHHPRTRLVECRVEVQDAMQPVRAPRWALLRLMLVLVDVTKDAVADSATPARFRLWSSEREAGVRVVTPSDGGPYGAEMTTTCGGTLTRDGDELVLTLPSLTALRQRERESPAGR
jgi:hypothetical protein